VATGAEGTVAGGVDDDGELPPPQDEVRGEMNTTAASAAKAERLRRTIIEPSYL
jgi:hypothetical protein